MLTDSIRTKLELRCGKQFAGVENKPLKQKFLNISRIGMQMKDM
jgi:hypothetical protein